MQSVELNAKARKATGKGAARKARAAGNIPAVLYGPGEEPLALEIQGPEFMRIYHGGHGENVLVDLKVDATESKKVLFREVQRDPVTESVLHVDFYHVSLTKLIKVNVPVHLEGTPVGVKVDNGVLQFVMREVEIECLPTDIPEHLTLDVSGLQIHQAVHVSDLPSEKWTYLDDPSRTVASVIPPVVSKESVAEDAAAEAATLASEEGSKEPERIGEKDDDEKAAEKGDEKK
jgi:large subunit ribosomal protein L25